jgi:hypothetical protein
MLQRPPAPEPAYRPVLGVLRLGDRYGTARLDRACARALAASSFDGARYLKLGLESLPLEQSGPTTSLPTAHENIRGGDYCEMESRNDHGKDDPEDARAQAQHQGGGVAS